MRGFGSGFGRSFLGWLGGWFRFWQWDFAQLGGVGEIIEIFQSEVLHEKLGGLVKQRTPGDVGASGDTNEVSVE